MWDVSGGVIQVEIGAGLVQRYSSKGFFGGSKDDGKLLLDMFSAVRERMQEENIYVPYIQCRDDNSLEREEFVVYAGAEFYKSNIQKDTIAEVIEFFARRYQLESPSKDSIHEFISTANERISQHRYADGLKYLNTAYYWSNLLEDCEEEAADITLQIGRILLQNQDMYNARLCAQRANYITSRPDFHNPYLKCASDEFSGALYMLSRDFSAADRAYTSALGKIANVPEANLLRIGVLSADLQALQLCENYAKANQTAQILIDVLRQSGCTNLEPLHILHSHIANCALSQMAKENEQLREEVRLAREKYDEAMEKVRFSEGLRDVAIILAKWAICNLPVLTGSLTTYNSTSPCTRIISFNFGVDNKISVTVNSLK